MALRTRTGYVLTFHACAQEMRHGRLALVGSKTPNGSTIRDLVCPIHEVATCLETYIAADHLSSWSLRDFWSWRSRQSKRGGQ